MRDHSPRGVRVVVVHVLADGGGELRHGIGSSRQVV